VGVSAAVPCRWCGQALRIVAPEMRICNGGCIQDDALLLRVDCYDCGVAFRTGRRFERLCPDCDAKDAAVCVAPEPEGYAYSTYGRGHWRT
jgi:hypothetical protein